MRPSAGLDHGGIGVFARPVLQHGRGLPAPAVARQGEVERRAAAGACGCRPGAPGHRPASTASMPLSGFGRSRGRIRSQRTPVLRPAGRDHALPAAAEDLHRAVGMAEDAGLDRAARARCPQRAASARCAPWSAVRSRWQRQNSASVLDGQSSAPSGSSTGLFLIGPRMPRGRRSGADQLRPPSCERISMPHQRRGLGPTL